MLKEIQEIEKSDGALYLRFSNHPIAKTHSYQDGVVAVDIDHHNEVVGIELLALGPNETKTLSEIVTEFQLSLDALVHRAA